MIDVDSITCSNVIYYLVRQYRMNTSHKCVCFEKFVHNYCSVDWFEI